MPGTPTSKYALATMAGTDAINTIDATHNDAMALLDDLIATADSGTLASRPTSTGGTPGKLGRLYYATDTLQLFFDYGTGWLLVPQAAQGTLAARPAAGKLGRVYHATDTGEVWFDNGTTWVLVGGKMPHVELQVGFGHALIVTATPTVVTWATEVEDAWGMHAASANTVAVPYDGVYLVDVEVGMDANATGDRVVEILVNGTARKLTRQRAPSAGTTSVPVSLLRRLAAGDLISVRVEQTSGGNRSLVIGEGTELAVHMISA